MLQVRKSGFPKTKQHVILLQIKGSAIIIEQLLIDDAFIGMVLF